MNPEPLPRMPKDEALAHIAEARAALAAATPPKRIAWGRLTTTVSKLATERPDLVDMLEKELDYLEILSNADPTRLETQVDWLFHKLGQFMNGDAA